MPAKPLLTGAAAVLADIAAGHQAMSANAARVPLGRDGRRLDIGTVHRLWTRGRIGPDGQRILLESAKVAGGGRATTMPAIARFHARLNGLDIGGPSPADLDRAHRGAERRLEAAGL